MFGRKRTEQDGQIGHFANEHVQHLVGHILNLLALQLVREPGKHLFFVLQITYSPTAEC